MRDRKEVAEKSFLLLRVELTFASTKGTSFFWTNNERAQPRLRQNAEARRTKPTSRGDEYRLVKLLNYILQKQ